MLNSAQTLQTQTLRTRAKRGLDPNLIGGEDTSARVRRAAAPDAPADVLFTLAADPAITVRAAVAMNAAAVTKVNRVLAQDKDARVRTLLAHRLAGLIPDLSDGQHDRLRDETLAILGGLVADEATRVRLAIAEILKDMHQAPHALIVQLARDTALAVADPIIRFSPLLTSADLLALLASGPSSGTVAAVARRDGLNETVSDAVAATADRDAIAVLLSNPTASIREATLDALVAGAREQEAWHAPLVRRPRLNPNAARALSDIVATDLLDMLANRPDFDATLAIELRRRLAARLQPPEHRSAPEPGIEQAMAEASRLFAEDLLDEDALIEAVRRGEARLATALLAVAADVSAAVVDRAATLRSAKGLVSLVWKAGFSMRGAAALQTLLARLAPSATLRATTNGGFPLAVEEMRWQIDFLSRMGR